MAHPFSLDGRTALITGASRGLGWAMAEALAGAGAHVVLNGREQESLDRRAGELRDRDQVASTACFDVADRPAAVAAVERLVATHGSLDILINNAGIQHREALPGFGDADWDRVLGINLDGPFALARAVAPGMIERGHGRIINTVSIMGPLARPTIPAYVASKGGLAALTRALAIELAPAGVTCNGIAPGYIVTDMTEPLVGDPAFDTWVRQRTPVARWGRPAEVAAAALFLASDAASYVNGHVLFVDGGLSVAL